MKKIIIMLITVLGIFFIIPGAFAIEVTDNVYYGSYHYIPNQGVNDLGENTYRVTFSYLGVNTDDPLWGNSVKSAMQNYSVNYGERDAFFSGGKSFYWFFYPTNLDPYNSNDYYPLGEFDTMRIIANGLILYRNGNVYRSWTLTELEFMLGENFTLHNITRNVGYSSGYDAGLIDGRLEGYDSAQNYYGIYHDDILLTAEQWGEIRYDDGYLTGLNNEIDWFSWSMTYFLMPFRILNIQILPGIRIGYFALFTLLLGVVGWFFFIVGKGGGRKK